MTYKYGTPEWEESFSTIMNDLYDVESPPYIMGAPSWILAWEKLIQADDQYRQLGQGWEGTVVIHIEAEPSVGLDDDMYLLMDLWHGDCRSVRLVPKDVGEAADFVITGKYERWKQVMIKELDVVKGMMQGKVKLRGDLPTIVRYAKASTRLVDLVGEVPTIRLDEMAPEEIEAFKPWIEFFREEWEL
jgi:putative sterol carrier protein